VSGCVCVCLSVATPTTEGTKPACSVGVRQ